MVKLKRTNLKDRIKQTIIKSCKHEFHGIFGKDKDVKFDELIKLKHTITREGHLFCEFHATIKCFAQREEYETWSDSVVDFQVKNGGGIALSITGYEGGLGRDFELRLDEFPVIELWKKRQSEDSFNPSIKFTQDGSDDTLGKELVQYLSLVDGDVGSTYESLYKYYKELADSRLCTVNKSARTAKNNAEVWGVGNVFDAKDMLKQELDPDSRLKSFLMKAN